MHIKRFVAVKAHAAFVICVFHSLRSDPRFNRFVAGKMVLDRIPTGWYFPYQLVGIFMTTTETRHESKRKLLDAALRVIREKGYSATRVEDICEAAGLTKGSFFHHFDSKEALALAAADYWIEETGALFATAPYHEPTDPVERLLAYVDFRKAMLLGELPEFTCLVGTMVQEVYDTHPALREACNKSISGHAATLVPDIEEAMRRRGMKVDWTAESLALYTQAAIQGAFILAKAQHSAAIAGECIDHLRRYLELLFGQPQVQVRLTA
jgi:TetR/AcrR family transcriptional repressor of nem operon